MAQFEMGDLVCIKSGGPTMTIAEVKHPTPTLDDDGAQRYRCEWFAGAKIQAAIFDEEVLEPADDEGE